MAAGTQSDLGALTSEQINKAFEKVRLEVKIPEGKLVLVNQDLYDEIMRFGRESYVPYEPVSVAMGCQTSMDWELYWLTSLQFGLSLALINEHNGEVIGMQIIVIGKVDEKCNLDLYTHYGFKETMVFGQYCDDRANFFKHFAVKEAVHFSNLAVGDKYKHRGIASKLVETAICLVKNLGIDPICIKAEGSSDFSKKIFEKNGFEILYEQPYDEYVEDGRQVICGTGPHKSTKVYGKRISSS